MELGHYPELRAHLRLIEDTEAWFARWQGNYNPPIMHRLSCERWPNANLPVLISTSLQLR
jgi:hypothetical protein